MVIQYALVVSVLLQFGAFFNTLTLIRKTKFNVSWISISIAFLLMAVRRLSELATFVDEAPKVGADYFNTWIAVLISFLMFIASFYIRRIFNLQEKIDRMRQENEAKVLSAIMATEEKERQLFARELHDGLGPVLSSIKMAFSAIDLQVTVKKNRAILEKTETSVDNAITTVREISNNLSPHLLERFGLKKAIRTFFDTISKSQKPELRVSTTPDEMHIPYSIEVILYRILCELVNNTLKHSMATMIEIHLVEHEKKLCLYYYDNGKGLGTSLHTSQGTGLSNIRSRVKSLDGQMELQNNANHGFSLKINLPLP